MSASRIKRKAGLNSTAYIFSVELNPEPHFSRISACVLCGGLPVRCGVYLPYDSWRARFDWPDGQYSVYGLCGHCYGLPDYMDRVESVLGRKWQIIRPSFGNVAAESERVQ
jgi:hypothetical protein